MSDKRQRYEWRILRLNLRKQYVTEHVFQTKNGAVVAQEVLADCGGGNHLQRRVVGPWMKV